MKEIKQRDERITDLSSKYKKECEIRTKTEKERKHLSEKLVCLNTITCIYNRNT